jgi:hypothetical protein
VKPYRISKDLLRQLVIISAHFLPAFWIHEILAQKTGFFLQIIWLETLFTATFCHYGMFIFLKYTQKERSFDTQPDMTHFERKQVNPLPVLC